MSDIPSNFQLYCPSRRLIREGPMIVTIFSGINKKLSMRISYRVAFLFNDVLIMTKDVGKGKFHWKGSISLSSAKVELFSQEDAQSSWNLPKKGHRTSLSRRKAGSLNESNKKFSFSKKEQSENNEDLERISEDFSPKSFDRSLSQEKNHHRLKHFRGFWRH
eukprot:TRINITY_DN3103_c0_g1_i1.p1 TRINITY_DN3103_c0_g1~~TRINITY_DN3103_c0_g1_i1.p1  ORF type:complete len:162 (-),score=2.11 TRINITY_DN3103_c0_g1_i1:25-510(-)